MDRVFRERMKIKDLTKYVVLSCLITVVIVPVWARLFGFITSDDLKAFGQFAVTTSAPLGVLIAGLASGTVARNRNGNGNGKKPA